MLKEELELTLGDSLFSTDNTSILKHIFSNTGRYQIYIRSITEFPVVLCEFCKQSRWWGKRTGLLAIMEDSWEGQNIWKERPQESLHISDSDPKISHSCHRIFLILGKMAKSSCFMIAEVQKYAFVLELTTERSRSNLFTTSPKHKSWSRTTWLKSDLEWMF